MSVMTMAPVCNGSECCQKDWHNSSRTHTPELHSWKTSRKSSKEFHL